jgi:peptidoglycan/xylan/chitin deacetylase (PgdA/CDA1 family)
VSARRDLPGALVISLDFEIHWGVRDHTPPGTPYDHSLLGARAVVPRMLDLFEEFGIAATWATVGFLFARSRADLDRFRPQVLPEYVNRTLFPYDEPVGADESDDPLHFASGLIDRVVATPRQEVATHTYSHYFCNEAGQTLESFRADLQAAAAIAAARQVELRSIVFPRNQVNPRYLPLLPEFGITAFRGNPSSWMWRFGDREESAGPGKRAARLADAYVEVAGDSSVGWDEIRWSDGLADVRASQFVRPYHPRLRALEPLRVARMRRALRSAARRGRVFHIWWHPHNFGAFPDQCLSFLRAVLQEYSRCNQEHGMQSLTMAEVAERALGTSSPSSAPLVAS